jgi:hypothetical protein
MRSFAGMFCWLVLFEPLNGKRRPCRSSVWSVSVLSFQLNDCRLGNIYKAIPNRHFALLTMNQANCAIHLIFSDESDADKLNGMKLRPSRNFNTVNWLSLYMDNGRLTPVLARQIENWMDASRIDKSVHVNRLMCALGNAP